MMNLKQLRAPSESRAFRTPNASLDPVRIVRKAIAKFGTMDDYDKVIGHYRRSDISDDALITDFKRCDVPLQKVEKDALYFAALEETTNLFAPPWKYRPVHFTDLRFYLWTKNTSVEAPFSTNKDLAARLRTAHADGKLPNACLNFGNCFNEVFVYNRPLVHLIKDGKGQGDKFFYWNNAHARSHLVTGDDPDKVRMVHGVPKLTLQVELMLLWPYLNWLRKGSTPIAWGYETLNGGLYRMTNEISTSSTKYSTWLCLDWRMFDKLTKFEVINDVHSKWQSFMDCDHGYIPTSDYPETASQPKRIASLWKWMSNAVKHTPIRLPDGSEWKRTHSTIASGLLQTQILGSWINTLMIITILKEMGYDTTKMYLKVLGDDSIIGLIEMINPRDYPEFLARFAAIAKRRFGAILSLSKSSIRQTLNGTNFLGYINENAIPIREPLALLAQLAYPERNWDINKLAARAVGICWASCGQSKLVYNVCKDVFDFCVNVGKATPDQTGVSWMEYLSISTTIDVSRFPTMEEIHHRLLCTSANVDNDRRFWNPAHFLSDH